jgi:hypothetical protein
LGESGRRGEQKPVSDDKKTTAETPAPDAGTPGDAQPKKPLPKEINGPKGPEPTRYGDWEKNGICSDF